MMDKSKQIEFEPDAWPRFERFIRDLAKAGPQHRKSKAKPDKSRTKKTPQGNTRSNRA